jgi:hypothetical protein
MKYKLIKSANDKITMLVQSDGKFLRVPEFFDAS